MSLPIKGRGSQAAFVPAPARPRGLTGRAPRSWLEESKAHRPLLACPAARDSLLSQPTHRPAHCPIITSASRPGPKAQKADRETPNREAGKLENEAGGSSLLLLMALGSPCANNLFSKLGVKRDPNSGTRSAGSPSVYLPFP